MILTLAWKEMREHRAIWFTMAVLTALLGPGLGHLVASGGNPGSTQAVVHLTIIGLAGAYGAVCGAMMLAGEHETGTMTFLDVFLGRRGLLWAGKFFIGMGLVVLQALAVALILFLMKQAPPTWGWALIGMGRTGVANLAGQAAVPAPWLWFLILPPVILEAYAWGLLGSSVSRRVLSAAAIGAGVATPVWLLAVLIPSPIVLILRVAAVIIVLLSSHFNFLLSLGENPPGPQLLPDRPDRRRRMLDRWERHERWEREPFDPRDRGRRDRDYSRPPPLPAVVEHAEAEPVREYPAALPVPPPLPRLSVRPDFDDAGSPVQALLWLTFRQAWALLAILAGGCFVFGMFVPAYGQLLWPLGTLLIGVGCGTAAFGAEQRDLSYQFLAAQHLPLKTVWSVKVLFWVGAALVLLLLFGIGGFTFLAFKALLRPAGPGRPPPVLAFEFGNLRGLLGPVLFFTVWLVYGFCAGLLFVWLCRKLLLALMLSIIAAIIGIALWMPSLLAGGMGGWQLWLAPVVVLAATLWLIRPWSGGRIKERRPLAALFGLALVLLAWAGMHAAYRAWHLPDVGPPLDRAAFRAALPSGPDNAGGAKLQEAIGAFEADPARLNLWVSPLEEASRLPLGLIESPPGDGGPPLLRHLPSTLTMSRALLDLANEKQARGEHAAALEHLAQALALARHLRFKAPFDSFLMGARIEEAALISMEAWLIRSDRSPALLRDALKVLDRHAAETPSPLDSLQAECFRTGGLVANPSSWSFAAGPDRLREPWLANWVSLALDMPWEAQRKDRLWQLVWAGLFRALKTPYWDLPPQDEPSGKDATRRILKGWLPDPEGPSRDRMASLLDASWLADERLFAPVVPLRVAGNRSRWRTESTRLSVALALFQVEQNRPADRLEDLVPAYLPSLPVDPYSGQGFRYRLSKGEPIRGLGAADPGQGILWSTGPDRADHGGTTHGGIPEEAPGWPAASDLITLLPRWK